MPIQTHDMSKELPGDTFGMLLVGKEQSGKSRLAATAPGPVLFIDTDKKSESLRGMKDVYALTITDPPQTFMTPTGFTEIIDIQSKLEKSRKLRQFNPEWPDIDVRTEVFDSIATLSQMARNFILFTNPKELAYSVTIGQQTHRVPKSWTAWGAETSMVESLILQARAIPNLNVIATLHESPEEDPRSTEDAPMFTGRIEVYPARYRLLLKYFSEIWRLVRATNGAPTIYTQPSAEFQKAGTALGVIANSDANIQKILASARGSVVK